MPYILFYLQYVPWLNLNTKSKQKTCETINLKLNHFLSYSSNFTSLDCKSWIVLLQKIESNSYLVDEYRNCRLKDVPNVRAYESDTTATYKDKDKYLNGYLVIIGRPTLVCWCFPAAFWSISLVHPCCLRRLSLIRRSWARRTDPSGGVSFSQACLRPPYKWTVPVEGW